MKTAPPIVLAVLAAGFPWSCGAARGGEGRATKPVVDLAADTATHREVEPLAVSFQRLSAISLDPWGCLLATDENAKQIKIIDRCGRHVGTVSLEFEPEAIDVAADGTIYCGGQGQLAALDPCGRLLASAAVPDDAAVPIQKRRRRASRPLRISGIAVSNRDVFVAFGSGWSLGSRSRLYRFNRDLSHPKLLAEGLRGCCQRCDIVARDGVLYLAENSAHRVVLYDREGRVLGKWGERSRSRVDGFGSCCNPMNLAFDARGVLYTAESGLGRIKRYTVDGQYLGLVGYVGVERFTSAGRVAASCSNIAIAVPPGGGRVYVMDNNDNIIRVLERKYRPQRTVTPRRGPLRRILSCCRIRCR